MCDFRIPPHRVYNKETKEWKDLPLIGAFSVENKREELPKEFGLYHRIGSGCGYEFYDGEKWWSIDTTIPVQVWGETRYFSIDDENEKYKFQRPILHFDYPNIGPGLTYISHDGPVFNPYHISIPWGT